jgi:hypothetical protein
MILGKRLGLGLVNILNLTGTLLLLLIITIIFILLIINIIIMDEILIIELPLIITVYFVVMREVDLKDVPLTLSNHYGRLVSIWLSRTKKTQLSNMFLIILAEEIFIPGLLLYIKVAQMVTHIEHDLTAGRMDARLTASNVLEVLLTQLKDMHLSESMVKSTYCIIHTTCPHILSPLTMITHGVNLL